MYVCVPGTCLVSSEGMRSSATGVSDGCEPPCGCWGPNPGPLQEQQATLNHDPLSSPSHRSSLKLLKLVVLRVKPQSLTCLPFLYIIARLLLIFVPSMVVFQVLTCAQLHIPAPWLHLLLAPPISVSSSLHP